MSASRSPQLVRSKVGIRTPQTQLRKDLRARSRDTPPGLLCGTKRYAPASNTGRGLARQRRAIPPVRVCESLCRRLFLCERASDSSQDNPVVNNKAYQETPDATRQQPFVVPS